jgi:flagellar biogenesis protein FliO
MIGNVEVTTTTGTSINQLLIELFVILVILLVIIWLIKRYDKKTTKEMK